MPVKTGIDVSVANNFKTFQDQRLGLLVHPASVNSEIQYTQNLFLEHNQNITCLFAPEHGIKGDAFDMIPVNEFRDEHTGLTVYSLYGKELKPTPEMLENIDTFVFDLQDIGARYYTFIWSMALAMQACAEHKKQFIVLDRPNPINGINVEGTVLNSEFSSFVGLYPIAARHGMTTGELAKMFNKEFNIGVQLTVIKMGGWQRKMWFDDTGLPWVPPSSGMPTIAAAAVYPGMCLLEGTNISEGRGICRQFEFFGAPWVDAWELCRKLNNAKLPGVTFRATHFIPSRNKFKDELCNGAQIHISDRNKYLSFLTAVFIIKTIRYLYPDDFQWRKPPYEYEKKKMPFDLLAGNDTLRQLIDKNESLETIQQSWQKELNQFQKIRQKYLLY